MGASLNSVIIAGNVTRDIELRHTASGTAVCDLGLAINERRKQGDEWIDDVTFVDVIAWGRTAEVCAEYLEKGSPVLIQGRLKLDQWQTTEGEKRSKLRVVCDRMQMIGSRPDREQDAHASNRPAQGSRREQSSRPTAVQQDNLPGAYEDPSVPF